MPEKPYGDFSELREIPIPVIAARLGLQINARNRLHCPNEAAHSHVGSKPTVTYFPSNNRFRCWVCDHVRGDAMEFARIFANIAPGDWESISRFLFDCIGKIPPQYDRPTMSLKRPARALQPAHIDAMNLLMKLSQPLDPVCCKYLISRRIDPEVAAKCGVRCFPDPRATTKIMLRRWGRSHPGLTAVLNSKNHLRFWMHRLVFPYLNPAKDVVYLQGRDPTGRASTKESAAAVSITLPWIPGGALQEGPVWICEGVIDALTLLSVGISAIALPGARTWRPEWPTLFAGHPLTLCLNPDQAGEEGAKDILASLPSLTDVQVLHLPPATNINYLALQGKLDEFLSLDRHP